MDQKTAKQLFEKGGVFIFLDVPEGTEFGIDMKSWNTGENFRGVKMIPPGIHYIFYSSEGEVLVKKWDKKTEDISKEEVKEEEIVRLKDNILVLDKFLGPYPYDILEKWNILTLFITTSLIDKLTPISGQIRSALELVSCSDADRPRGDKNGPSTSSTKRRSSGSLSEKMEDELLPHLKPKIGTDLRLTAFPEKNYPDGSTASEITQHHLDSTFVLETIINKYDLPIEIIGEMSFVYVCFLVGHSLEAFEHWKKLVILLCSCDAAIKKYRDVYDKFVTMLEVWVKEIPEEFLADIVSNNNFVYIKLREFFKTMCDSDVDGRLKTKVQRFQETLTEQYGWDFSNLDSEDEEDQPVIVELE